MYEQIVARIRATLDVQGFKHRHNQDKPLDSNYYRSFGSLGTSLLQILKNYSSPEQQQQDKTYDCVQIVK